MRLIMLDVETTGLSPKFGDRIVEIGAIEIVDRKVSVDEQHRFHRYINPERDIPPEVVRIHGVDNDQVANQSAFREVAQDFLKFIEGATLVIHNASFDLGFIINELDLNGFPNIDNTPVIDTLAYARSRHPQQRNNLDALCDRYGISCVNRELHGALVDAMLLADVYLAMTKEPVCQPASTFIQQS